MSGPNVTKDARARVPVKFRYRVSDPGNPSHEWLAAHFARTTEPFFQFDAVGQLVSSGLFIPSKAAHVRPAESSAPAPTKPPVETP